MANLDFDDDEGPISLAHRRAALNLATSMGDDPEEMSRALQLSQSSGVPAPIISADLEGFEKEHKADLSNELVKRNQFLQAYLADETSAKLSHDDVGPLDQASESIGKLNQRSKLQQWLEATNPTSVKKALQESAAAPAARGLAGAFEEGYGPQPLGWAGLDRPEDLETALSHPLAASVLTAAATPLEFMARVTKGLVNLGHSATESIFGKQFADDMAGMVEYAMTAPEIAAAGHPMATRAKEIGLEAPGLTEAEMVPRPPEKPPTVEERQAANLELVQKHADKLRDLMHGQQVSDIFHEAGEEPPPYIDPLIDKAKADQIREDLQRLKDAMRDSAATATRERSQDHFARFAELHGPGEIGIDSAEIRRIYGEKAPEEGDGLLGWIPNLGDRLASPFTEGEIWVDRAQFLAKTEREVVNEIGDGLRLRDGGKTIAETKIEADPKQVIADELPAIRGGAGMEPRAGVGDRKISLRMREAQAPRGWERTGATGMHDLDILDDTGKSIGSVQLDVLEDGKLLHINNIQAGAEKTGLFEPNSLGYSSVKDLKRQLKQMFPEAEWLTGTRISGARAKAGAPTEISTPRIRLDEAANPQEFRDTLSSLMAPGEAIRMHGAERDTTVGEHLRALYPSEGVSPLTREILDRLTKLVGDVELKVRHDLPPDPRGFARAGFYNTLRNDIHVLSRAPAYTAVHEAMHPATYQAIEHNPTVRANIEALMDAVDLITDGAHEKASHPANYAMTSPHEFVAEAFSNPKLQRWMAKQEITPELRATLGLGERQKTLWQAFVSYIRKALGLSEGTESLLERVLSVGEEAFVKEPVKVGVEGALQVRTERAARELGVPSELASEDDKIAVMRRAANENVQLTDKQLRRLKSDLTWREFQEFQRELDRKIAERKGEAAPPEELGMAEPEIIPPRAVGGRVIEGYSEEHPEWAKTYLPGPNKIVYSRGNLALREGTAMGQRYYTAVKKYEKTVGGTAYDVRNWSEKSAALTREEAEELKAVANRMEKAHPVIEGEAKELGMAEHPEDREHFPVEGAKAVGVPKGFLEREERLLKELQEKDWEADKKRQAKQIREQLLPEAKARGKEINKQVREEFEGRPELAVDKFMSEGQVKFDPDHLTAEQKARLPKDYVAKGGMNPDDLAGTLGYTSGDAMVERLAMLTEDRKRSGLDQKAYFNKQLRTEVEKRLNAEFGPKRDELLQEYRDHALSETQMQLTHVETIRKAVELGIEPQFTLDDMKAMAKSVMDETPIGEIKSARYLQKAGATAMKVAEAEQKGKHPEAYRLLQQKQLAQLVAKGAMEYERTYRKSFDRMAGNFVKTPTAETAKRIDIPYYNWVQQVLARVGYNVDVRALAERVKLEDHQTLNDFVAAKHAEMREINVPQFVLDQTWPGSKRLKDLTYGEFKDLHDFVKTMQHEGRDEKMLVKGGEQIALDEAIDDLTKQVKSIASLPPETLKKDRQSPVRDVAKGVWWGHITPETMWDRLDRGNKQGLFHQLLIYPAARAVNDKLAMLREYGKRFNEIDFKDMDKVVENTLFRDPETGQLIEMRRRNMLGVLAYWGNESNIKKLTEGWGVERQAVESWLRKNSRPEDWAEMQKIGGIFKDLMKEAQKMSRAVTGVPIKEVDIQPFTDPHGFSRDGWYSPVDYEAERPKGKATGANELERPGRYRVTTDQRYAKQRTGKIAPTDLTLDIIPQRMEQMIHDITTRPTSIEMGKILHNEKIQSAINSVYGKEQMNEMRAWLQDMTNQTNVDVAGQKAMNQAAGFLRANVIGNLVGLNPATVLKHSSTAAVNSIAQVGPLNFLKATKELFQTDSATGLKNAMLHYNESKELQGRLNNLADRLRGQGESFQFEQGTIAWLRELSMKLGSLPIGFGDYLTTLPVFRAARMDALARGATLDMAIDIGNKAVRDAHGAVRLTTQPSIMRTTNEMARMYSSLYGFFSHMLQQQYKVAWKARDLLNGQKPLDIEGHWAPHMLGKFMSYYIVPAVIEELITPYTNEEKDSWGMKAAKGLTMGLSSSLTVVRDLVRTLINPEQRTGGLMDTVMDTPRNVIKDLSGPMTKQKAANLVKDTIALNGILTGLTNATEGRLAEYIMRYSQGLERPKGPWDVAVGLRYGKTDKHTHTAEEWWEHTVEGKR